MAHSYRIENLDSAWGRADEAFGAKLCENARDHFADGTDAVREILLIDQRGERAAGFPTRSREVEEVARDALADRRECVSGELLEHVVQPMGRFHGECPSERRVGERRAFDRRDVEEERRTGRHCLHEHRRGARNQRRYTEQITCSNIPHGDLAPVTRVHVNAQEAQRDDGQCLGVGLGIHGMTGGKFYAASAFDQRLNPFRRHRRP